MSGIAAFLAENVLPVINALVGLAVLAAYFTLFAAWKAAIEGKHAEELARRDKEISYLHDKMDLLNEKILFLRERAVPDALETLRSYREYAKQLTEALEAKQQQAASLVQDLSTRDGIISKFESLSAKAMSYFENRAVQILRWDITRQDVLADAISTIEVLAAYEVPPSNDVVEALVDLFTSTRSSRLRASIIPICRRADRRLINDLLLKSYVFISHDAICDYFDLLRATWSEEFMGRGQQLLSMIQNREEVLIAPLAQFLREVQRN